MKIHDGMVLHWLATGLFTLAAAQSVQGISFTAPVALEGNSVGWYPFDGLLTGSRFQQVFAAPQFSLIGNGGSVFYMAFRQDGSCRSTGVQIISNLQVNLSTTSKEPDSLSPVFAENVGPDDTVVFGPGRISLVGSCAPANFMAIWFTTPFFYNPNAGNLLVDIRNISGSVSDGSLLRLDGHDATGDSVSSILGFSADAQRASTVSSFGFVTELAVHLVPVLSISLQSSNVVIRWAHLDSNYMAEESPVLGATATWQTAGGIVSTNGPYKQVVLPVDKNTTTRFFRLASPPTSAPGQGIILRMEPSMAVPAPND